MHSEDAFHNAGGVMGGFIRKKDWSKTPMGAISKWPESLRTAVSICLGTSFPVSIYWGDSLTLIYNDAWSAFAVEKHPMVLGEDPRKVWPEFWIHIGPVVEKVFNKGVRVSASRQLMLIDRGSFKEETYFDYSFSPIRGKDGEVLGIFNAGLETTSHVLSERRTKLLQTLFNNIYSGATEIQILEKAGSVLESFPEDIPYFALYTYSSSGEYRCVSMVGLRGEGGLQGSIHAVLSSTGGIIMDTVAGNLLKRDEIEWTELCCRAFLMPITLHSGEIVGFVEAGISPHRQFDEQYKSFLESIASHISSAVSNARAQKDKEISTRQLRDLFMIAPVSIVVFRGPEFIVEAANDRVREIWGKPDEKIEDKALLEVLPELQNAPVYHLMQNVYSSGERIIAQELKVKLLRDGIMEDVFLNFVFEPIHDEAGAVARTIVVAHDVTDLVTARQQAQLNAEKLTELMQQKDEFLSITSHELKTPITSVKAYMQLGLRVIDPMEKAHGFVSKANAQLERLEKLISDLLDVSKINAGRMTYSLEPFDFKQLLLESIENVQHSSPQHQIVVKKADEARIVGDRMRIEQVLNNFLNNAVKYSPDADKILVCAEVEHDDVVVSIQDFGIGIEREHLAKLFDRFYRVENTAMRYQGLGLGLYISSEIIKKHKGSFWIESEPGKGSSFYFKLPLYRLPVLGNPILGQNSFYEDEFITLAYDEKNNWLNADWRGIQTDDSIKDRCQLMLNMMKQHSCSKVLNCNENVEGNWSAAIRWLGEEWFPAMEEAGLKCFAWILSPDSFSQLAALKSINIFKGNSAVKFFLNRKEAQAWLEGDSE